MIVRRVSDFLEIIKKLQECHVDEQFYFRGESRADWQLRPSVMRDGYIRFEREMLTDLMARRPEEFAGVNTAMSQWVLGQHHGLKTRFLDVTRNPLVALFHATEFEPYDRGRLHIFAAPRSIIRSFNSDTISLIANFAKLSKREQDMVLTKIPDETGFEYSDAMRHLYHFIRQEKPYFEELINVEDLFRVLIVEPQQFSERIRVQSGAFLLSAFHERFERDEILAFNSQTPIYYHYKPTIFWNHKRSILRELRLLNISRETLYPGLDESARAITDSYRQRLEQG